MASTIYNDLKYIQEAEKVMDANLKATTGINTESFTLMEKANTILKKNNTTDYVVNYQRPEWYPNADDIINSAPKITYEDDTYYPYMLIFMREYQEEINTDASNYFTADTGSYTLGIIFNDTFYNDNYGFSLMGKSSNGGASYIYHKFDTTKDIVNPNNDKERLRWAIIYYKKETNGYSSHIYPSIKGFMAEEIYYFTHIDDTYSGSYNQSCYVVYGLQYIKLCESLNKNFVLNYNGYLYSGNSTLKQFDIDGFKDSCIISDGSPTGAMYYQFMNLVVNISDNLPNDKYVKWSYCGWRKDSILNLKKQKTSSSSTILTNSKCEKIIGLDYFLSEKNSLSTNSLSSCYYLKELEIPSNITSISNSCGMLYSLEKLILHEGLTTISASFDNTFSLKRVDLPSTLTSTLTTNLFQYCTYIGLWNDFDRSSWNFTGSTYTVKESQWFKDLCVWLRDRTGLSANTIIVGSLNIAVMQRLWLTYDSEDKNNITWVEEGTDGAITCLEYITNVKNWTVS